MKIDKDDFDRQRLINLVVLLMGILMVFFGALSYESFSDYESVILVFAGVGILIYQHRFLWGWIEER